MKRAIAYPWLGPRANVLRIKASSAPWRSAFDGLTIASRIRHYPDTLGNQTLGRNRRPGGLRISRPRRGEWLSPFFAENGGCPRFSRKTVAVPVSGGQPAGGHTLPAYLGSDLHLSRFAVYSIHMKR